MQKPKPVLFVQYQSHRKSTIFQNLSSPKSIIASQSTIGSKNKVNFIAKLGSTFHFIKSSKKNSRWLFRNWSNIFSLILGQNSKDGLVCWPSLQWFHLASSSPQKNVPNTDSSSNSIKKSSKKNSKTCVKKNENIDLFSKWPHDNTLVSE